MRNPFVDFGPGNYQKKENPVERNVCKKRDVLRPIMEGYSRLLEKEFSDLAWLVEHQHVVRTYSDAVESIRGLQYDPDTIEAFCEKLERPGSIPYKIPGPAGLYLSALVNQCKTDHILLRLMNCQRTFHFLGYGLAEGKTLVLQGDGGDFIGAGLHGGRLVVKGSTGNWCGAGMMKGEIWVDKHAGQNTGEWMQAGEIRIDGFIGSLGKHLFGGRIYQQGKLIFGANPVDHFG